MKKLIRQPIFCDKYITREIKEGKTYQTKEYWDIRTNFSLFTYSNSYSEYKKIMIQLWTFCITKLQYSSYDNENIVLFLKGPLSFRYTWWNDMPEIMTWK